MNEYTIGTTVVLLLLAPVFYLFGAYVLAELTSKGKDDA